MYLSKINLVDAHYKRDIVKFLIYIKYIYMYMYVDSMLIFFSKVKHPSNKNIRNSNDATKFLLFRF